MTVLDILFSDPIGGELVLTKSESNASLEISACKFEYTRCFLWHPDFVRVSLFGDSRTARLKVDVRDEIVVDTETSEWIFAFPMKIDNDNQAFFTDHDHYYRLDIDAGTYYIVFNARRLTSEEIEEDPELMAIYSRVDMPLDTEIPYKYSISFCKSKLFRKPKIFHVSDRVRKVEAIYREFGRPQDLKKLGFYDEIYVLNSDYEPVLLEDSQYEFGEDAD